MIYSECQRASVGS